MKLGPHLEALLTAIAIVFISALIWLGIASALGLLLPWPVNAALLVIAVFALYRLFLVV